MFMLMAGMDPCIFLWVILLIAFVVGELITVGLTSIWFAAGSLVALLAATRPWAKKYINSRTQRTNADRVIGETICITERVSNMDQTGMAVVNGQEWTVRTRDDREIIEQGAYARVLEISGVKLIVEKA